MSWFGNIKKLPNAKDNEMDAKYGQIAESNNINLAISTCFNYLSEVDQKKFVTKFKDHHHKKQVMDTFRELILGAYLSKNNYIVEYARKIGTQEPDWTIVDKSQNFVSIIEMVAHHIDDETNTDIEAQLNSGRIFASYRPDGNDPDHNHLYSRILKKATGYKDLITELDVPYVVAIYFDFKAVIDVQETIDCLTSGEESLFKHCPYLSGVLHFEEANSGKYGFWFIENQHAFHKINIPSGYLEIFETF
jgi:hypothetical protein